MYTSYFSAFPNLFTYIFTNLRQLFKAQDSASTILQGPSSTLYNIHTKNAYLIYCPSQLPPVKAFQPKLRDGTVSTNLLHDILFLGS